MKPYPLDHCVLPTRSLPVARTRLSALGFTVAADAAHPFGTANCCVFFEDGTYLEPLAIADEELAARAVHERNTFIDRDRRYRETQGTEGFSALVLGTTEAEADHARFASAGISAGSLLSFSRPFVAADGVQSEASFKLAFAAPADGDSFFFTCERVKTPTADRASLQRHPNGVVGISQILLTASRPTDYEHFLTLFCGSEPSRDNAGLLDFSLANATVSLTSPEQVRQFGTNPAHGDGLSLRGITFRVQNVSAVREKLVIAETDHEVHENRIVVPPAPGQGATFIFEEFNA